jgi:hypothetical protein
VANDPIDKLRRTAYPNPERRGCPEPAIFEALQRREISFDDPIWTHIEHCSPCYCQFSEIRETNFRLDRRSDLRRMTRTGATVVVLLAVGGSFYVWHKGKSSESLPQIAQSRREAAVLNLEDGSGLRGAHGSTGTSTASRVQHLPRNQLDLTVFLPLGSPAGDYELEILRAPNERIWHASGHASIKDGLTSIPVTGDLQNIPAGEYSFRFRRPDETWHEKLVLVQ